MRLLDTLRETRCFPRVTPGRSSTLALRVPESRLMSEDLPTFGMPTIIMLAFIGSVKDQILDIEYLAMRLLDTLRPTYTAALAERYKLDAEAIAAMEPSKPSASSYSHKKRLSVIAGPSPM